MEIIIISAIAINSVIGNKTKIPWHIKEDFQRFKSLTLGHPCIMGDITYNSLPDKYKPLPERENIILTLDKEFQPKENSNNITIAHDVQYVLDYLAVCNHEKVFVIGGAIIYNLFLKYANTMELTIIVEAFEGDIYFPKVNWNEWKLVSSEKFSALDCISKKTMLYFNNRYERI